MNRTTTLLLIATLGLVALVCALVLAPREDTPPVVTTPSATVPEDAPTEATPAPGTQTADTVDSMHARPGETHETSTTTAAPRYRLEGRVLQAGQPLRCTVRAAAEAAGVPRSVAHETDETGRFTLHVPRGYHRVSIDAPSVPRDYDRRLYVIQATSMGDLDVPVATSLRGAIVDADRQPVAGARIYLSFDPDEAMTEAARKDVNPAAVTDEDGHFVVHRVFAHPYAMLVDSRDHPDFRTHVTPSTDATRRTFVLERGNRLHGSVVGPTGSPVANAVVTPCRRFSASRTKAVQTDENGAFTLTGARSDDEWLAIAHPDYQPRMVRDTTAPIVLEPALILRVRVEGNDDRPCHLRIETHDDDTRDVDLIPYPMWSVLMEPLAPQKDGEFVVRSLTPGIYALQATAAGYGKSESVRCDFTESRLVTLSITPGRFLDVHVVDDDERPIVGAHVAFTQRDPKTGETSRPSSLVTDEHGRVVIERPACDVTLVARAHGRLRATLALPHEDPRTSVSMSLASGGAIAGRLDADDAIRRHVCNVVAWRWRKDGATPTSFRLSASPDATGRYRIEGLASGTYGVGLYWWDDYDRADPRKRRPQSAPLLGTGLDPRTVQRVTVRSGETARHDPRVHPHGTIEGRVFRAGEPVANVLVIGQDVNTRSLRHVKRTDTTANRFNPQVRTAPDGSFSFDYLLPQSFELFAIAPGASLASEPVAIRPVTFGSRHACEFHLASGVIRGRLDWPAWPEDRRGLAEVKLLRAKDAENDPFHITYFMAHLDEYIAAESHPDGRFQFTGIPPGDWVVRATSGHEIIDLQRLVRLRRHESHDLGLLRPPTTFPVTLVVVPPAGDAAAHGYGVRFYRRPANTASRLFECVALPESGSVNAGLPAGTHEAELFALDEHHALSLRPTGTKVGRSRTFRVAADGSITPAVIRF